MRFSVLAVIVICIVHAMCAVETISTDFEDHKLQMGMSALPSVSQHARKLKAMTDHQSFSGAEAQDDSVTSIAGPLRSLAATAEGRIAYGQQAPAGKYPYVVTVRAAKWYCTGTLIAPRVVLTAAFCLFDNGKYVQGLKVAFGSNYYSPSKTISVKDMHVPAAYIAGSPYANIGLIELAEPSSVKPVALATPSASMENINSATLVGFGRDKDGKGVTRMSYTTMSAIQRDKCADIVTGINNNLEVPGDNLCFGLDQAPPRGPCYDLGAPYLAFFLGKPIQAAIQNAKPANENKCSQEGDNFAWATSVAYWYDTISNLRSYHNLNGKTPPSRRNTIVYDKCYTGTALKVFTTPQARKCTEACRSLSTCNYWTWREDTKECTLFSEKDKTLPSPKCDSGYF